MQELDNFKSYLELECHIVVVGQDGSRGRKQSIHAENLLKKMRCQWLIWTFDAG